MQEKLISFETAKLAEEKNCTLRTFGGHPYNYYNKDGSKGNSQWAHINRDEPACVPQSLLQKWLRETHDIHIEIKYETNGYYLFKLVDCQDYDDIKWLTAFENQSQDTYELALEFALQEALKLINV